MASMNSFYDTFQTGSQSALWTGGFGTRIFSPNKFTVTQAAAFTGYGGMQTNFSYDLTGAGVATNIESAGNQSLTSLEFVPVGVIDVGGTNKLFWYISQNVMSNFQTVAGSQTQVGSTLAYTPGVHNWFRIREAGGTTFFEWSTDGFVWNLLNSVANPITMTALLVNPSMGTFSSEASGTSAVWLSFNYYPPVGQLVTVDIFPSNKRVGPMAMRRPNHFITRDVAFPAFTGTFTQTATANLAVTVTKTQTATARIANNFTKTQTATANIVNIVIVTKTQTAIARIANNRTKTQTAIARIANIVTKTQGAIARIAVKPTKTQSAIARIANIVTKTQTATARIQRVVTKTQSAIARIVQQPSKTQSAIARIAVKPTLTQTATARIAKKVTKTQTAKARIVPGGFAWKGYIWTVRSGSGAPAYNGQWNASGVTGPDVNGYLTFHLTNPSGSSPFSVELDSDISGWGYGTYTTTVGTRTDNLDSNVVWGSMFTYDGDTLTGDTAISHNEIDTHETSFWGGPYATTGYNHFWNNAGVEDVVSDLFRTTSDVVMTHRMIWQPGRITFESYIGSDTTGTLVYAAVQTTHLPVPALEKVMFNLWVGNFGGTPASAPPTDIVLRDFTFTPTATVLLQTAKANIANNISDLTEDFSAATYDTTKWSPFNTAPNTSSQATGKLVISTGTTAAYSGYSSNNLYALTNSALTVELVNAGNQALASLEVAPATLIKDANSKLWWLISGNTLYAYKTVGGVGSAVASVGYNNTTHRFLRIREGTGAGAGGTAGTTYWDYSTNGITWTNFTSLTTPFAVGSMQLEPSVGTYANEASGTSVTIDNINLVPGLKSKTQTAKARIAKTVTKTQTATARIAMTVTKTQTATAHIKSVVTKTQTATAKISVKLTKTQTATARILPQLTKNQTATARITNIYLGGLWFWNGSVWVSRPIRVWTGTAWVTKPLKRWDGTTWRRTET